MSRNSRTRGAVLLGVLVVLGLGLSLHYVVSSTNNTPHGHTVELCSIAGQRQAADGQGPEHEARRVVDPQEVIESGRTNFATLRETSGGSMYACVKCHGSDGSGLIGPDIRPSRAAHLLQHAHGDSPHPVKFPGLTQIEVDDIAMFLESNCLADPECEPGSVESHEHEGIKEPTGLFLPAGGQGKEHDQE